MTRAARVRRPLESSVIAQFTHRWQLHFLCSRINACYECVELSPDQIAWIALRIMFLSYIELVQRNASFTSGGSVGSFFWGSRELRIGNPDDACLIDELNFKPQLGRRGP